MRMRRAAMATLLCLAATACQTDPSANHLWGIGDPVRGAALWAPRNLGDTSRWAGKPADAAIAVGQLEFLAHEMATNPRYAPVVNPAVPQTLQWARTEMRDYLGIPAAADPQLVIEAMRRTAASLRAGSRAQAEATLSGPSFPAGPAAVLARLSAMPRLPRTAEAAGMVASEMERLERQR
ncbi:hypothetical protein [Roseicella aerolata]|uniref:Uncharacterized protein n=1 Tax=Roseicella aerolata TaxID=2883479 RepID=A0A9X1L891_9PROT|nr:hypothetical protein [Roseicella aerolata]MCB4822309.1 hypothetical protein [Roseicella aerolata]